MCSARLMDEVERKEGHVEGTVDELGSLKDPGGGREEQTNAWVGFPPWKQSGADSIQQCSRLTGVIKCKERHLEGSTQLMNAAA